MRAYAMVDPDRHDLAAKRWSLLRNGYVMRTEGSRHRTTLYLHREVLGLRRGDGWIADHINRDKLDNRRANLRKTTPAQSRQNTPSYGRTSAYRGVSWDRTRGRWMAHVSKDGRQLNLGRFDSEQEAAAVARAWRIEHMPFATE